MESPSEGVGESDGDGDGLDAQVLKHLDGRSLVLVDDDSFGVQHQDVHGEPFGGHPQWVTCVGRNKRLILDWSGGFYK